jgi:hypothetical protein
MVPLYQLSRLTRIPLPTAPAGHAFFITLPPGKAGSLIRSSFSTQARPLYGYLHAPPQFNVQSATLSFPGT